VVIAVSFTTVDAHESYRRYTPDWVLFEMLNRWLLLRAYL